MTEYNTVRIPRAITEEIHRVAIESGRYRTVSEFVIESTRQKLETIERNNNQ